MVMRQQRPANNAAILIGVAAASTLAMVTGLVLYVIDQPGGLRLPGAMGGSLLPLFKVESDGLNIDTIRVKATNNTGVAISRARLRVRAMAEGRSVPIIDLEMTFTPTAGIEPGETKSAGWKLEEYETNRLLSGVRVSHCIIDVISLYDATGKLIDERRQH